VREAQSHEADDKRLRDAAENRNKAEAMAYQVEKTLRDYKEKIQAEDAAVLEAALKETREAVASGDDDRVKSATEKLEKESHRIATLLYQSTDGAGPEGGPAPQPPPAAKDDGVIDAEFEENK
jgi:molecular chaperone DnaK